MHFRHLLNSGLVHRVTSEADHFEQLGAFLNGEDRGKAQRSRFILEFLSPLGLDIKPASVGLKSLNAFCDQRE